MTLHLRGVFIHCLLPFLAFLSSAHAQQSLPEITASGSVSARAVAKGETVQFAVTIKNKSDLKTKPDAVAKTLHLQALPEGYTLEKICVLPVVPPRTAACQDQGQFEKSKNIIWDSLAPGQSITVQGNLESDTPRKASTLTVNLVWDSPAPGSAVTVSLGENQVLDWYQADWIAGLTKILAVPLVLALVTFFLNLLASNKEKREADRQHTREEAKVAADKEASIRTETWKQMLLISHNYAAKCYLPLSLAATRLSINLRALGTPQGDERIAFYYVLLCGREMMHTRKRTGGLYFKDLRGETLAAECWRLQRNALLSTSEEDPFNLAIRDAIDGIAEVDTYAAFKRKFEVAGAPAIAFNAPDIQNAWTLFKHWRGTNPKATAEVADYMEGFFAILDYEANRPYQYWYDTKPRLIVSNETEKILRRILEEQKYNKQEIEDYFDSVPRPN